MGNRLPSITPDNQNPEVENLISSRVVLVFADLANYCSEEQKKSVFL